MLSLFFSIKTSQPSRGPNMVFSRHCVAFLLGLVFTCGWVAPYAQAGEQAAILQALQSGQIAQGQELLKKEIQRQPNDLNLRLLAGVLQAQGGQKNEAIETFKKLTAEFPTLPEPHNNLGVLYAERGDLDLAKAAFERALQTLPSYNASHKNLMDLNARIARQAYARALRIEEKDRPSSTVGLTLLAQTGPVKPAAALAAPVSPVAPVAPKEMARSSASPQVAPSVAPAKVAKPEPAAAQSVSAGLKKAEPSARPSPSAPTPAAAPASAGVRDAETAAIRRAVTAWADAWSKREVARYLDAYSPGFVPPKGQSRQDWATSRRSRIEQRKFIRVGVSRLQVELKNSNALVRFEQTYESDGINTTTGKTLELSKSGGRWLIVRERAS